MSCCCCSVSHIHSNIRRILIISNVEEPERSWINLLLILTLLFILETRMCSLKSSRKRFSLKRHQIGFYIQPHLGGLVQSNTIYITM